MTSFFKHSRVLVAAFTLALLPAAAQAEAVLIANKSLDAEPLDAATIKSALLGKKIAWSNNSRVTLAVLKAGPVAEDFLKRAVDQTPSQFLNNWRRLAMTGGGMAPKSFETEDEVRKFVAENAGAIGFVEEANVDASVRVVKLGG